MPTTFLADGLFSYPSGLYALSVERGLIQSIERIGDVGDAPANLPRSLIDLRGKVVLPGLVDSHVHLVGTAMQFVTPSVRGINTPDELISAIADPKTTSESAAAKLSPARINKFLGLDLSEFPDRSAINARLLDSHFGDHPIMLKSIEGHSALLNTAGLAALELHAGLDGVDSDPSGAPTGVVRGEAYENVVDTVYDTYTKDEKLRGLDLAVANAISKGCAGIHCLEGYGRRRFDEFRMMLEYARRCPIDLTLYPRIGPHASPDDFDAVRKFGLPRVGGCELIDGAIGSFTAALSEPYAGMDTCGALLMTDDEIEQYYLNAFTNGLQPCFHVIGDRAIDQCLSTLERIENERTKGNFKVDSAVYGARSNDFRIAHFRPRLDHFIVASDDLIARAAKLGVCAGVQPAFMHLWGARGGKYESAIGADRWRTLHRYNSMLAAGMHIASGSDSYITPIDPLLQISAMMHHSNDAERVDYATAVSAATEGAAYLAFQENTRGRIAPGYEATFTVLDSLEPVIENRIEEAAVHSVWVRGNKATRP